jgi:hypothetical protein
LHWARSTGVLGPARKKGPNPLETFGPRPKKRVA